MCTVPDHSKVVTRDPYRTLASAAPDDPTESHTASKSLCIGRMPLIGDGNRGPGEDATTTRAIHRPPDDHPRAGNSPATHKASSTIERNLVLPLVSSPAENRAAIKALLQTSAKLWINNNHIGDLGAAPGTVSAESTTRSVTVASTRNPSPG